MEIRILAVDDNPANLFLINELLEKLYKVVVVASGYEAIERLNTESFDLILLDIMMPGIDGYGVCAQLKQNPKTSHIPVIFLTAKADTESVVKGFEYGAVDYIAKPFKKAELLARVKNHIELKISKEQIRRELQQRIAAEDALIKSEEQLRRITDNISDLITQLDAHGKIIYASPSWEKVLGFTNDEIIGKTIFDFAVNEEKEWIKEAFEVVIAGNETVTFDHLFIHKQNYYLNIQTRATVLLNSEGNHEGIVLGSTDITDQKQTENALIESEEKFRMLTESTRDVISILDFDFKTEYISPSIINFLGYTQEEFKQLTFDQKFTKDSVTKLYQILKEAQVLIKQNIIPADYSNILELEYIHKEGAYIWAEVRVSLFKNSKGEVKGFQSSIRDITERRKAENILIQNLRNYEILTHISTNLLNIHDFKVLINETLDILGNHLNVSRISIFEVYNNNAYFRNTYEWLNTGIESRIDRLQDLSFEKIPSWIQLLKTDGLIAVSQIKDLPDDIYNVLKIQNIISLIALPIYVKNEFYGFIAFDHQDKERIWNETEIEMLKTTSNILSTSHERRIFYQNLKENESKLRSIFEKSNDALFVLKANGDFYNINQKAIEMLKNQHNEILKKCIFDIIPPDQHVILKDTIERLKNREQVILELSILDNNNKVIPVEISGSLIDFPNEYHILFIARDISERKEMQRKLVTTIMQTEENERTRFAKDLHDGLGALLSSINIYVNMIKDGTISHSETENIFAMISGMINEAISNAKEIANNIRPAVLSRFGLVASVNSFIEKINQIGKVNIEFIYEKLKYSINDDYEIIFFRIINELINNALKHSEANNVKIVIANDQKVLSLQYSDDGKGFDPEKVEPQRTSGMGLQNIVGRIGAIGGKCEIFSKPGHGVFVQIEVLNE